jgi:hypothetical protein
VGCHDNRSIIVSKRHYVCLSCPIRPVQQVNHCVEDCSREWRRSPRYGSSEPSPYCAPFGCYSTFTTVYIFVNKMLDALTNLFTLPVVNKSFNAFNGLLRENHLERFERLNRSERLKKFALWAF